MKSKASTPTPNRILAIDPGFERLGIAILEKESGKEKLLYSECLRTSSKLSHSARLLIIGERIKEVIKKWKPKHLAIETLFFNNNITSALGVAESRGVVIYEATQAGLEVCEYSPQAIKIAITGFGAADKKQMESMIRRLVNLEKTRKMLDDELDAIALGITHLASKKDI